MSFKVGDLVKFLNDIGGGTISKIEGNVAYVSIEEGFSIPYLTEELILSDKEEDTTTTTTNFEEVEKIEEIEKIVEIVEEKKEIDKLLLDAVDEQVEIRKKTNDEIEIFFAFVPKIDKVATQSDLKVYLINDSPFNILYNYVLEYSGNHVSRNSGILEANTKFFIETYRREDLNDLSTFIFQFIPYKNGIYKLRPPIEKKLSIKPIKFYKEKSFVENDFFYEKSIIFKVGEDKFKEEQEKLKNTIVTDEIINEKNDFLGTRINYEKERNPLKSDILKEVDLHIHELIEDETGLSNREMLTIQLNRFRSELENAIINDTKKIVFIHGVGNGVLKNELRKILDADYKNFKYQDASFKEYGYGATLIFM